MKIYRVVTDANAYQAFLPKDDGVWQTDLLTFDATPKAPSWKAPDVFILHPKLRRGNFFGLAAGAFAIDRVGSEMLEELLEMSGELLPLTYESEQFSVLNVTECINVLDQEKTRWVYDNTTGIPIRIEKFAFHPTRLTETPLFKIPETVRGRIYTAEGLKDPEDEFKYTVEQNGLEGLLFEEVWSS